mmetsp:Transcript_7257/g.25936  ORF Transcript_7257/g.25936 Transcript_7257/m.25936 type:complete len:136 (-) Transcript_7257:120-527(-)
MSRRGHMSDHHARAELFGGYRAGGSSSDRGAEAHRDLMEAENERQLEMLRNKTSALRQVALDMHGETRRQNMFLDGMSSDMDRTEGILANTMGRLGKLMDSGGQRYMCYLICFVVAVFLILYFLLTRRSGGDADA